MEIRPLAAKVTANGSGNATDVNNATVLLCVCTSAAVVTLSNGGTFQMNTGSEIILHKEKTETVYANSANVHFTKIAYPRG